MVKNHSFYFKSISNFIIAICLLILCLSVIRLFMSNYGNILNNEFNSNNSSILPDKLVEYTYVDDFDPKSLSGLSNSSLIYEYIDYNFTHVYKTWVEVPTNKATNDNISKNFRANFKLPRFKIKDFSYLEKASYKQANSIFVSFNGDVSSNFIYKNNEYIYYKNDEPFIDFYNNSCLKVSNIIIQLCNEDFPTEHTRGNGNALLFQGGKFIKIKWDNEIPPIRFYDEDGNDITLLEGKTWWIITNKNTSIIYH